MKMLLELVNCDIPGEKTITDSSDAEVVFGDVSTWFDVKFENE